MLMVRFLVQRRLVLFFNIQEIFPVILSKLSWSAFRGGRGGGGKGQDFSISYLKQNCFSHGEVPSNNLYTNSFFSK